MTPLRPTPRAADLRGRLRRALPARVLLAVKCAVAATAAWLLARGLTSSPEPYYAPMTAFLMIQPTVAASLRDSAQYLGAAALGLAVALGLHAVLSGGVVALTATVCVAVLLGGLPGLSGERATVSFWALFALVVGGDDPVGYAAQRLPEAALGVVVGVLVNLAVAPPLLVAPAQERLALLRADLADVLQQMADDVAGDWPPKAPGWGRPVVQGLVEQTRAAVGQADESLRWNVRGRGQRQQGRSQRLELERLEQVALAVRALSGLLLDAGDEQGTALGLSPDVRPLLATALTDAARQVRGTAAAPAAERAPAEASADEPPAVRRLRQQVAALHHEDPSLWVTEGALVAQLEQVDRASRTG